MAVIKAGKTRLIKAGVIGAMIALVPAMIACIVLVLFIANKDTELDSVNSQLNKYKEGTVCVLKNDMERGQKIEKDNIEMVKGIFYQGDFGDYGNIAGRNQEDYVGMILKTDAPAGTVLNECMITAKGEDGENLRTYYIDYIDISDNFSNGTCFDIRICFPNGEDYLVAGNKEINVRDEEGFYVDLTRREALLLSSARVDLSIYEGAKIYAAFYASGFEEDEIQTYPVNSYVFSLGLWEPNIGEVFPEEMFEKRETLENNLLEFMGVSNNLK